MQAHLFLLLIGCQDVFVVPLLFTCIGWLLTKTLALQLLVLGLEKHVSEVSIAGVFSSGLVGLEVIVIDFTIASPTRLPRFRKRSFESLFGNMEQVLIFIRVHA